MGNVASLNHSNRTVPYLCSQQVWKGQSTKLKRGLEPGRKEGSTRVTRRLDAKGIDTILSTLVQDAHRLVQHLSRTRGKTLEQQLLPIACSRI